MALLMNCYLAGCKRKEYLKSNMQKFQIMQFLSKNFTDVQKGRLLKVFFILHPEKALVSFRKLILISPLLNLQEIINKTWVCV